MSPAARATAAALLLAIATLPVLSRQFLGRTGAEIPIFMHGVDALLQGRLYGEHAFEYPPYALIWFLAPYAWSSADVATFRFAFGLEVWLFDAAIKAVLLRRAIRGQRGFPDLIPFFVYSLGSAALGHLLLMKYDAIPAALSLAGVLAVTGGWPGLGGATMMLAAGTKAYPALFIPILAVVAWRRSPAELRRYAAGVVAVELITAAQGVDYHAPLATSAPLQSLHREVRAISPHLEADRYWADEMAALQAAVLDGRMSGGFLLSA